MKIILWILLVSGVSSAQTFVETAIGPRATGYLGIGKDPIYTDRILNAVALPASFDWWSKGVMTPIKDQGNCGSCYSFAITRSFESALMIQSGKPALDLSEQQIVSCSGAYGCGGGFMDTASFVVNVGLTDEASFPYTARNSRCRSVTVKEKAIKYELLGSQSRRPTVDEIKTALITYGPVFVTVSAGGSGWSGSTGSITRCRNRGTNHMVVLTGWDDKGNWRLDNSWGTNWGNKGHTLIKFGCDEVASEVGFIVTE